MDSLGPTSLVAGSQGISPAFLSAFWHSPADLEAVETSRFVGRVVWSGEGRLQMVQDNTVVAESAVEESIEPVELIAPGMGM